MKKIIIILTLTLIFLSSCTNPYFKKETRICFDEKIPTKTYFPLEEGKKWKYQIEYAQNYLNELNDDEKSELASSFEIALGSTQLISTETKQDVRAYPIVIDGDQNNYHYLIECSDGATMVEVFNPFETKIVATFPVFELDTDTTYWNGVSKFINIFQGNKTFKTNEGKIKTIKYLEKVLNEGVIAPGRKNLNPEIVTSKSSVTYYAEGIGLFMREIYDDDGMLIATYILEPYKLDYDTSPITP